MGTMQKKADVYKEVEELFGRVPEWARALPESALPGFWAQMRDLQLAETKIPNKYKELIGLAVAGATRCRYCALFHTEAARLFGATDEEIAEASAMAAFTMGPSTFMNAQQIDYEKFRKETLEIVSFVKQKMASQPGKGLQASQAGHAARH